jgi:hypothetical protein
MTMDIDVRTVGFDKGPFDSGGVYGPEIRARVMQMLALQVITIILTRVQRGTTPNRQRFQQYTDEYFLWKTDKGKMTRTIKRGKYEGYKTAAKGFWLSLSGQMLGSIQPLYFDGDRFLVGFGAGRSDGKSNALLAWVHDTEGCGKKKVRRPFFRLSEKEKTKAWERAYAQAQQEGLI